MRRIGIFGGSFDPVHLGHLAVARSAQRQLELERVFFVPAARSPFKQGQPSSTRDSDRLKMVSLAIEGIPEFEVCPWEIEQGGISYTVDTLRRFKALYPKADFFLLMGEDTYSGFERWKNPEEIRGLAQIAVAPREGFMRSSLSANGSVSQSGVIYLAMPLCETSSSQLRDWIQIRNAGLTGLTENVRQYIVKHGLYQ